jgi:tetratricopeptide (TPR) repeat protein
MKRLAVLLLAIPWILSSAFAQGIDLGRNKNDVPHPADLAFNISIDRMQNRAAAGLSVQLYDPSGNDFASQGSLQTDGGGRVVFHTTSGEHEFRITGQGIEDYNGSIQIMRQESSHVENIIVKSKPLNGQAAVAVPGSSDVIAASRLSVPDKAAKEFKAGSKALEAKNYLEAKKKFANATSIYADYSLAYNGLGVAQMSSGDTLGARVSFEKAIKIDDHFAEAYRNLARLALGDHKFEEMDDLLTKSLQSDPLNAWALTYAAYAELQTQKFDLAVTHARAAHGGPHQGLASVHIVAAHAFEATQRPAEALKEYKLYMEEDPNGRDAARAKQAIVSLSTTK